MTREQRYICNQQKELYEQAQAKYADVLLFSQEFLKSDFCNRSLDKPYSADQYADIVNWLEFLEWENIRIKPDIFQPARVSFEAAGWLGFVYRHLHFRTGLFSRELAERIPGNKLLYAYGGLHTVDEEMAIDIISKDFCVPLLSPEGI